MKRFRRWQINLLAGVSSLLCVIASALWVQSFFIPVNDDFGPSPEGIWFASGRRSLSLDTLDGRIIAYSAYTSEWNGTSINCGVGDHFWSGNSPDLGRSFLGVQCGHLSWSVNGWSASMWAVVVPYPYFVSSFALFPLFQVFRRYRPSRVSLPQGVCKSCGYDLRATPERCPECGTILEIRCHDEPIT